MYVSFILLVLVSCLISLPNRGPSYGCRGKVVLAFEENGSSKIGVRFDKSIPDGNDLGGLCEEDHGFFCSGYSSLLVIPSFGLPFKFFIIILHFCLAVFLCYDYSKLIPQLIIYFAWMVLEVMILISLLSMKFLRYSLP